MAEGSESFLFEDNLDPAILIIEQDIIHTNEAFQEVTESIQK